jgi:branched-chain amino acid transport system ATP-binding protein
MRELRVDDVHTYYGQSHVLQGLTLIARKGVVTGVVGRNGVGKTTLVRTVVGFTPPSRGRVLVGDEEIQRRRPEDIARLGIGLVPQGRRIFPSLTVTEQLKVAASAAREGEWNLQRVFDTFPVLGERGDHRGNQLSGGEQQMLAIGRALMTNPQVLIMDEPSEGLAPKIVQALGETVLDLVTTGLTILLVEQNLPLALKVSDRIFIISKGQAVYDNDVDALKNDHEIRRKHLGV